MYKYSVELFYFSFPSPEDFKLHSYYGYLDARFLFKPGSKLIISDRFHFVLFRRI